MNYLQVVQVFSRIPYGTVFKRNQQQKLSYHVETWVCSLSSSGLDLWNKQKV
jgi:hypothetical protein